MISKERAYEIRAAIEKSAESLDDESALAAQELFAFWKPDTDYAVNVRLRYDGKLYRVVQAHTSLAVWPPDLAPALYTEVAPPGEIPVWKQPIGVQDAYQTGDLVWFPDKEGHIYRSIVDNNVWSPDAYGWELVE